MLRQLKSFGKLTACFLGLGLAANNLADTIELRADDWCPYTCRSPSQPGLLIEIAEKIFRQAGHEVNFKIVPWSRAMVEVEQQVAHGIVGITPNEAPHLSMNNAPLFKAENHWFVQDTNPWQFENFNSLENNTLGAIEGYSYGDTIDAYMLKHKSYRKRVQLLVSGKPLQRNLRKLNEGKIDILIEDCRVVSLAAANPKVPTRVQSAGLASEIALFIGFSPNHPKTPEYLTLLNQGTQALLESGELANMLKNYPSFLCGAH